MTDYAGSGEASSLGQKGALPSSPTIINADLETLFVRTHSAFCRSWLIVFQGDPDDYISFFDDVTGIEIHLR